MKNSSEVIAANLCVGFSPLVKMYMNYKLDYCDCKGKGFSFVRNLHVFKDASADTTSDNLICYLVFKANNIVELKKCKINWKIRYAAHFYRLGISPRTYNLNDHAQLLEFEDLIYKIANL